MITICNTSPLLYLHQIGRLQLLRILYGEIFIPPAVESELLAGHRQGVDVPNISQISWIHILSVQAQALIPVVTDLGAGEAEVIGLALEHPDCRIILDDQLGRRVASINHIKLTGTFGVVLKAKQLGHLEEVRPIIQNLRDAGLWISDSLEKLVLTQAGEIS